MAKSKKFLADETRFAGRYANSVYDTLLSAYRPYFWRCLMLLILGFLGRALVLSNANFVGIWVDSFCHAPAICKPLPHWAQNFKNFGFLILLSAVTTLGFLCTLAFRVGFSRLSAHAVSRLYDEVTLRCSRYPMGFFDTTPTGRIVTRFSSDYGNVFRLFGGPLAEYLSIIFDLICMALLVSLASPYYLPVCFGIGIINYGVYRLNRDGLRTERRELSHNRSPSISHFAETAQGASTVRTYQKQLSFIERFRSLNGLYLQQRLKTTRKILAFSAQISAMTALLLLATGLLAYYLLQKGILSIGSIGVAFSFIILSGNTLQMLFEWMAQFEEAMIGAERLDNYLRLPIEPGLRLPPEATFGTGHPVTSGPSRKFKSSTQQRGAEVNVSHLWFRYRGDLPYVLKDLDFKIQAGEKLGVVGRTGSGKSSLIQALFHLYPIERGEIKIEGYQAQLNLKIGNEAFNADERDLTEHRQTIALISQDPTLFRGTLRENLTLDLNTPEDTVRKALLRVGLLSWLELQPNQLEMKIEERGRNLSAGERQLICMARCLLQDTPVVVMDEATSTIDPQSEEVLVRATNEIFQGRTQIIVAHRLSTLQNCDRILWLQNGEIKMLGPTREVLPIFARTSLETYS